MTNDGVCYKVIFNNTADWQCPDALVWGWVLYTEVCKWLIKGLLYDDNWHLMVYVSSYLLLHNFSVEGQSNHKAYNLCMVRIYILRINSIIVYTEYQLMTVEEYWLKMICVV